MNTVSENVALIANRVANNDDISEFSMLFFLYFLLLSSFITSMPRVANAESQSAISNIA